MTKQVSVKHCEENSVFGEVSYKYLFNFVVFIGGRKEKAVGAYLSLGRTGREVGGGGCLFEAGCLLIVSALLQDGR